jgi:hypothetical protein
MKKVHFFNKKMQTFLKNYKKMNSHQVYLNSMSMIKQQNRQIKHLKKNDMMKN